MTDLFRDTYRIPSARLDSWDYGDNAAYFVTICTAERQNYFGEIVDGKMVLPTTGETARQIWLEIPSRFPYVLLDEFVVMPNHIHGIVIIDKPEDPVETRFIASKSDAAGSVIREGKCGGATGNKNPMLHENLSKIIRWYKGRTTFETRKILSGFDWQARFHDHIIRDNKEFDNIREYIINNPVNWGKDKFYTL